MTFGALSLTLAWARKPSVVRLEPSIKIVVGRGNNWSGPPLGEAARKPP
jgi:hypothetical protein